MNGNHTWKNHKEVVVGITETFKGKVELDVFEELK